LTQILISTKFEKEIVFESAVLAWIRIEQKCWIRIRINQSGSTTLHFLQENAIHEHHWRNNYKIKARLTPDHTVLILNLLLYKIPQMATHENNICI
jgi:hypothetical protein